MTDETPAFKLCEMKAAVKAIRKRKAIVSEGVVLPQVDEITYDGEDALEKVWDFDLAGAIDSFLGEYTESQVRTTKQLIRWNTEHKDLELPPGKRSFADHYARGLH